MVEIKAKELGIDINELIWGYINRGLMSDGLNGDVFKELHSKEYLAKVNKALGIDWRTPNIIRYWMLIRLIWRDIVKEFQSQNYWF